MGGPGWTYPYPGDDPDSPGYRRTRSNMPDPVFCEHANEMPMKCPCPADCYCKSNACRPAKRCTCGYLRGIERGHDGDCPLFVDKPHYPGYEERQKEKAMGDGCAPERDESWHLKKRISGLEAELAKKGPDYVKELNKAVEEARDHLEMIANVVERIDNATNPVVRCGEAVNALALFDGKKDGYEGMGPKIRRIEELLPNAVGQAMMSEVKR